MKKKTRNEILIIFCIVVMCGCGHKSKEELADIEQFRCQDSIQTVFEVFGESELITSSFGHEYYEYENLNLWGYDGSAIFYVRDNKDTIQDFECKMQLSKKEFQDVLHQLEDKYGEYEKHEYSNQISYVWEIPEDEAEEFGYNRISFSDYGDKKSVLNFRDEWSMYKDEEYYKHLEEEKEENILAQKTYNIGEDTFDFSFWQKGNGDYSFTIICMIEDKSDAYMTHISLNALFNSDDENIKALIETMNFTYGIIIGDETLLIRTKGFLNIANSGGIIDVNDYFSIDWILSDENKDSDYGTQVINFLIDFIENE